MLLTDQPQGFMGHHSQINQEVFARGQGKIT
jgi:hypothetical protein